ncbi:MAG: signal peptidase I [Massiliimalia sp.]|jgi:signal peptidase
MQKVLNYLKNTVQMIITALLVLLLACNLYLMIMNRVMDTEHPTIFGYSAAVVASGSMEPALSVDDLIINHVQKGYQEGDIITFQNGDNLTTHRIVAITDQGYVTQGDANNAADLDTVTPEAVVGRVVGVIPNIGTVLSFLKTPFGVTILIFTGLLMLGLPCFLQRRREQTDGEEL